ncbi:hypothetical protein V6N13_083155 [Hibiscus sabdariffa]
MYGTSDHLRKHEDWNLLDSLWTRSSLQWLLGGDLNAILCRDEEEGGRRKPYNTARPIVRRGVFDDYFKFDACWANDQECEDIVRSNWASLNHDTRGKFDLLGVGLHDWQSKRRRQAVRRCRELQACIDYPLVSRYLRLVFMSFLIVNMSFVIC